jgi:hypothetical protein
VNTDASGQATVDTPGGDSRPGLSSGWVAAGATILALAIRLFTLTRPAGRDHLSISAARARPDYVSRLHS